MKPLEAEDWYAFTFEQRVLMDFWRVRRVGPVDVSDDVVKAVNDAAQRVQPYLLSFAPGQSFLGISPESYQLWAGNPSRIDADDNVFTLEKFERAMSAMLHTNCPMRGCEDFDLRQVQVPVAGEMPVNRWSLEGIDFAAPDVLQPPTFTRLPPTGTAKLRQQRAQLNRARPQLGLDGRRR